MHHIIDAMREQVFTGDGAMGTMLQGKGLPAGVSPEIWMLSNQEKILEVMTSYVKAGACIVETNTFGANSIKLREYGQEDKVHEINAMAVTLARKAAGPGRFVAGVIGPSGAFPSPVGEASMETLIDVFAWQAQSLSLSGADFILLQTFADLGEARAAFLGVRKVTNLPIAVSFTYGQNQRTLTGTDPETAATVFAALGADMLGVNCSTGPEEMLAVVSRYQQCCGLPLFAEPNAGLPYLDNGRSVFPMSPEDMTPFVSLFLEAGVRWLGGCCGTTPAHIKAIAAAIAAWDGEALPIHHENLTSLASRSRTIHIGAHLPTRLISERLNLTAVKSLSHAVKAGDFDVFVREGEEQAQAGADMLNINVNLTGSDEAANLTKTVQRIQQSLDCPLVFDSVNPAALEQALLNYQGKALINSVNGSEASLAAILPLARQYGAAVVGLTLDENGVPDKAEDRVVIAGRILARALEEGLAKEDVVIDCLVMAAASDPRLAAETLKTIALVKEKLGLTTVLGISNISHGMPARSWLNQVFLCQAIAAGLDAAIANPLDPGVRIALAAGSFLAGRDPQAARYIACAKKDNVAGKGATGGNEAGDDVPDSQDKAADGDGVAGAGHALAGTPDSISKGCTALQAAILRDDRRQITTLLQSLSAELRFIELIDRSLIPALAAAGDDYSRGETFLPQLLQAADGAAYTFDALKTLYPPDSVQPLETVVLGTVDGDVHDIGKNIVKALLSSYGYQVVDLGKSVSAEAFVRAVKDHGAKILGLSALMTTTMTEMEKVIQAIRGEGLDTKIIIGGAVMTAAYAESIHADAYVKDAVDAHGVIRRLLDSTD